MYSTTTIISIIFSVIIGNILCAEINTSHSQNPWKQVNTSNVEYTQGTSSNSWPALGQPRYGQNNIQPTPRAPQWVRPNNGPNWVRNTPTQNSNPSQPKPISQSQSSNSPTQNSNPSTQISKPSSQNSNSWVRNNNRRPQNGNDQFLNNERNTYSNNRANTPNQNSRLNQGRPNGNLLRPNVGVNNVVSSGSMLTGSEDVGRKNPGTGSNQDDNVDDNEIRQLSEELLKKDNSPAQYVNIHFQGMTTSRSNRDEAPLPLLTINQAAYSVPTISKLLPLYDNYIVATNKHEEYSAQEKNEENDLLTLVLQTPVMEHTRNFLIEKGKIGRDPQEFKELLRQIWFNMYSRGGRKIGSSGFEHVFLAEVKNNQVSGLHNWIYFNEQEKKHNANYLGYMKKIDLGGKGYVAKVHFTFQGIDKPVASMFVGTSPELEMALYSACFILRADRICPLKMNGNRFIIRTYTFRYGGKNLIGSAFPEL